MGVRFRRYPRSNASGFRSLVLLLAAVAIASAQQPDYRSKLGNNLAPYVSSPQLVVDRMLELASVKAGDTVYDLGCGDGRVLITAVQRYNAKAVGIEISGKLVQRVNEQVAHLGLQEQIKVIQGDLRQADFSDADVVVMYLLTGSNAEIRPQLEKLLKPGARVVSYSYAVPGWKPSRIDKTDERHGHTIYLYQIPAATAK